MDKIFCPFLGKVCGLRDFAVIVFGQILDRKHTATSHITMDNVGILAQGWIVLFFHVCKIIPKLSIDTWTTQGLVYLRHALRQLGLHCTVQGHASGQLGAQVDSLSVALRLGK